MTSMRWLASSVFLFTQAKALGDVNKVVASPPQGGGLQAHSSFSLRLRPSVTQINFPFHNLEEVAYKINLASHRGRDLG